MSIVATATGKRTASPRWSRGTLFCGAVALGVLALATAPPFSAVGTTRYVAVTLFLGLVAAIRELTDRSTVAVRLTVEGERQLAEVTDPLASTLWFVAAESLTNVARHAHAETATVRLWAEGDVIGLEVRDDGIGGAEMNGSGLTGLRDRARALGGDLRVEASASRGARVTMTVPR